MFNLNITGKFHPKKKMYIPWMSDSSFSFCEHQFSWNVDKKKTNKQKN